MYSKQVMKHFANPHNVGEIKDPDGIGEVGNPKCGDIMKITIKVGERPTSRKFIPLRQGSGGQVKSKVHKVDGKTIDKNIEEYIEDVKFLTMGCAAAIAASSMMTDLAKGKSLDEAEKITRDDINDSLGQLPPQKYHCSILSAEGIHKAIEDYKSRKQ